MYEIRLNDGTGEFEIRDMTNNRTSLIIAPNGNVGVGDAASTIQDFVIGCNSGFCNIQTRALDGAAANTVKSLGGAGDARFRIDDVTSAGRVIFEMTTQDDGTVCLGSSNGVQCMLIFDIKGPNPGQVKEANGNCIANC